jgi:putative oxidoreductase
MHLTTLGIAVKDDNGYLFLLALIVFVCSIIILSFNKEKIMLNVKMLTKR